MNPDGNGAYSNNQWNNQSQPSHQNAYPSMYQYQQTESYDTMSSGSGQYYPSQYQQYAPQSNPITSQGSRTASGYDRMGHPMHGDISPQEYEISQYSQSPPQPVPMQSSGYSRRHSVPAPSPYNAAYNVPHSSSQYPDSRQIPYIPSQSGYPVAYAGHPSAQYASPMHAGSVSGSPPQYDYTTQSSRPYACDQCTLSFNRQHDLKRHKETHSKEKPYLCNGGCGKTFTRKDALKRHQIVKGCGQVEESWQ